MVFLNDKQGLLLLTIIVVTMRRWDIVCFYGLLRENFPDELSNVGKRRRKSTFYKMVGFDRRVPGLPVEKLYICGFLYNY